MSNWSFAAQRADTGAFLSWDLPLTIKSVEWALSGPGSLQATIEPDEGGLRGDDGRLLLEEWGTLIYAISGDEVRWGGILIQSNFNGESWDIEAAGFSTYLHARYFQGELSRVNYDVAEAVRALWYDVQRFPDGDLGMVVTGPDRIGVLMGTDAVPPPSPVDDGTVSQAVWDGLIADGWTGNPDDAAERLYPPSTERGEEAKPYELMWYDATNCGSEMDELAKAAPFDWVERHRWDDEHEAILHEFEIAYPRAGRRRDDLSFVLGDNVTSVVTIDSNGDDFANVVIGLGSGEGRAMIRQEVAVRDGRLRREHVYADKAMADTTRLAALISEELNARRAALRVESIDVQDHSNAPLGSWEIGDDVLVRAELPWVGEIEVWCRIVGWTLTGENTATLSLVRSDLYRYGGVLSDPA